MTRWNILLLLALGTAALALAISLPANIAFSQDSDETGEESGDEEGEEEDELHEAMEHLGDDLKALRRSIVDESKLAATLEIVARMQQNAWTAKGETPESLEEVEDADARAAAAVSYRLQMAKVLGELCALEVALLEGNQREAIQHVRNLATQQRAGHEDFRVDDEDED